MYKYFNGESLYGDDFSKEEIAKWYEQEAEAYADIYGESAKNSVFGYHNLNNLYGYSYLKHIKTFKNVLGIGSSWGYEFLAIIDRIKKLTILESSIQTKSSKLGNSFLNIKFQISQAK